jgi:tRNA A-37 threonylcarbamoyl transferase component Bud32
MPLPSSHPPSGPDPAGADAVRAKPGLDQSPADAPATGADALRADTVIAADLSTQPDAPRPAVTVQGYDILGELGRGGMGVVYKARQRKLNRIVALKMVLAGAHAGELARARFLREADLVARLRHLHIVQIIDLGEEQGQPYFAMEFVDGGDLKQIVAKAPLPPRDAAQLVEKLARAVGYAHEQGIVHRDLKPANVLLTPDGEPKIGDFGLAKTLEGGSTLSSSGAVVGTPAYMAPEQARGATHDVGPPTDVHALGVMLYELLTGHRPFEGQADIEVLQRVAVEDATSPAWFRAGIPRDLERICMACLRKNPAERYPDGTALADDLRRYLNGDPPRILNIPWYSRGYRWVKKRPARSLGLVLATLLLGLASLAAWKRYEDHKHHLAYEREVVESFAMFTTRWGALEGVGLLTAAEAQRRPFHYEIIRSGTQGPVRKVRCVDGYGRPYVGEVMRLWFQGISTYVSESPQQRVVDQELKYDALGRVEDHIGYNRFGEEVLRVEYTYLDDNPRPRVVTARYTQQGFDVASETQATALRAERTPEGFDQVISFLDGNGRPAVNRDNVSVFRFTPNQDGLPTLYEFLDAGMQLKLNVGGYAMMTQEITPKREHLSRRFFDAQRQPIAVSGAHRVDETTSDGELRIARYDVDNELTDDWTGYAAEVNTLNDHGQIITCRLHNAADELTEDFAWSEQRREYDAEGRLTAIEYRDSEGDPVSIAAGYFVYDASLPLAGFSASRAEFTYEGTRLKLGVFSHKEEKLWTETYNDHWLSAQVAIGDPSEPTARRERSFDDVGRLVREDRFEEGRFVARMQVAYNERGQPATILFRDEHDAPVRDTPDLPSLAGELRPVPPCQELRNEFDPAGRLTAREFIGCDPALGYHTRRQLLAASPEPEGTVDEEQFFDDQRRPQPLQEGSYPGFTRIKVDRRRDGETPYLFLGYPPNQGFSAYSRWAYVQDEGYVLVETWLDDLLLPVRNPDGVEQAESTYATGSVLRRKVVRGKDRQFDKEYRHEELYDPSGRWTETRYLDAEGKLTTGPGGFAIEAPEYLPEQLVFHYRGPEGQPVDTLMGYARRVILQDADGNVTGAQFFNARNEPVQVEPVIWDVVRGQPGESLGLRVGDVIVRYDGVAVDSAEEFRARRPVDAPADEQHPLVVRRDGVELPPISVPSKLLGIYFENRPRAPSGAVPPNSGDPPVRSQD